ncbi:MAG: heavy-metal-associated domain-containing protein [Deltaproteobacteria bacterium]|nr:heavy-metal-associated domain-containing protein [Deltaproteobacteria bacterium]RLB48362.1 MAG: hypothetical protein DRJ42_23420 [Deltaproteobacteria bacterium]
MIRKAVILGAAALASAGCQSEPSEVHAEPAPTVAVTSETLAEGEPAQEAPPAAAGEGSAGAPVPADATLVRMHIEGLLCEGCAEGVKGILEGIDGVYSANVDFSTGTTEVRCDASRVRPEELTTVFADAEMDGTPMDWVATIIEGEGPPSSL